MYRRIHENGDVFFFFREAPKTPNAEFNSCTSLSNSCPSLSNSCPSLSNSCTSLSNSCTSLSNSCTSLSNSCTSLSNSCPSLSNSCTSLSLGLSVAVCLHCNQTYEDGHGRGPGPWAWPASNFGFSNNDENANNGFVTKSKISMPRLGLPEFQSNKRRNIIQTLIIFHV